MTMRRIIILALMALPLTALAQPINDTLPKREALAEHLSLSNDAMTIARGNPALMEMAYKTSLTQFGVVLDWQDFSEAFVLQKGMGHTLATIKADTYLRMSPRSAVWGKAAYMTGKMRGIKWSSVADYDLLAPDVLGDSVGGDTRREQYVFEGGYASRVKLWRLGGEMLFRAEQEYRKVDPRVRSIVSDLTLRAGAAREFGSTNLALSMEGNIYRQTNSVDFYKPLGSVPEYQLMGLGAVYARFSGDINDLFYKGGGIKLQADLIPTADGLLATVQVAQHHYERVARLLNSLPLTTLYNREVAARVGWRHSAKLNYAVWGDFKYNRRTSDQHLAGTSSSQIYPVIATLTMYKSNTLATSLTAIVGREGRIGWNVKAQVGYVSSEQEFVYPHRAMDYGHAYGNLTGQVIASVSRSWFLTAMAGGNYRGNISKRLVLPLALMEPHFVEMLNHNYRFKSANYAIAHASLRADYHFARSRFSIFLEGGYDYTHCTEREHQNNVHFTIGINM